MNYDIFNTNIGDIAITEEREAITSVTILSQQNQSNRNWQKPNTWFSPDANAIQKATPVIKKCQQELEEYLHQQRTSFSVKIAPRGTAFQQQVWAVLSDLRFGECASYQNIASQLNKPTASRAVGAAVGKNPIAIIIPCHRVMAKNQKLTGYAWGLDVKEILLELENIEYNK